MHIHQSAEDYLEAILRLRETKGQVRSVDISLLLGVTKPSVSFAMKKLRENEYIHMDHENLITLTDKGATLEFRELALNTNSFHLCSSNNENDCPSFSPNILTCCLPLVNPFDKSSQEKMS